MWRFLRSPLPNIVTNMHIMFQVIPIKDDKVILRTSEECYKNDQKGTSKNL